MSIFPHQLSGVDRERERTHDGRGEDERGSHGVGGFDIQKGAAAAPRKAAES